MVKAILMIGLAGCTLSKQQKTSCNVPKDCLDGYACENGTCVPGPDGGGRTSIDAPVFEYGDVQPLTVTTSGVTANPDYTTVVGVTTAPGGGGCALLASEHAAPGTDAALAYLKFDKGEAGDTRCPNGTFSVLNDPSACSDPFGLNRGCAIYKRWDSSGVQVASRLAIGGYVTIQDVQLAQYDYRCNVDLSLHFTGGITIAKTYTFDYNALGPAEAFCVP